MRHDMRMEVVKAFITAAGVLAALATAAKALGDHSGRSEVRSGLVGTEQAVRRTRRNGRAHILLVRVRRLIRTPDLSLEEPGPYSGEPAATAHRARIHRNWVVLGSERRRRLDVAESGVLLVVGRCGEVPSQEVPTRRGVR